jgi:hypothetical protein
VDWINLALDRDQWRVPVNQMPILQPCSRSRVNTVTELPAAVGDSDSLCSQLFWQYLNFFFQFTLYYRSWDSSVGIGTGCTAGIRFPAGASDNSLLHSVQTGSGAHPATYLMDTRGCLPRNKAAVV